MPTSSWSRWARSQTVRRAVALSAVVLATGGLVLHRSSASAFPGFASNPSAAVPLAVGRNAATFTGPGAHGVVSLSHGLVNVGQPTTFFAEVRVVADAEGLVKARAPIALAVVLDTSGSMSGEKIEEAKRSVLRLLSDMRDDDEIALVRYSDSSELVQPLARVGDVREALEARIQRFTADGGTNIPSGLESGLRALDASGANGTSASARGRVRRVVLVSDGLDATRARAEELARAGFVSGATISSLGVGLDFDESYMGSIAQSGHGNFAFVEDGQALTKFLSRELEEASSTTVENAKVHLTLPPGVRFVSANGADAKSSGRDVELAMGSLFAGDERRVIVELTGQGTFEGAKLDIATNASWRRAGSTCSGGSNCIVSASASPIVLVATHDLSRIEAGRDGAVLASAASVTASRRQLEAASAYARGDVGLAARIVEENETSLSAAMTAAPPAVARSLGAQLDDYRDTKKSFTNIRPQAAEGRAAAKAAAAKETSNLDRKAW